MIKWEESKILETYSKDYKEMLYNVESMGRVCYQSKKSTEEVTERFIKGLIKSGHESVLEHETIGVKLLISRAIAFEIVRHRIGSYSMESTRYVNYTKKLLKMLLPKTYPSTIIDYIQESNERAFNDYCYLINVLGATPEQAREVLPNNTGAEIGVTYNIRQWRTFFKQRCSKVAHPEIRYISMLILKSFIENYRIFFEDLEYLLEV